MQGLRQMLTVGLVLLCAGGASAALVDDARLAAAKRAADEFMRRAEGSVNSGEMPRRSDPAVAALLDIAFNNAALGTGVLPLSESGKIGELLGSSNRIGLAYLFAGTGASDLATTDTKVLERADQNVATFAPEIGQWFDFQIGIQNAFAAGTLEFLAGATPAALDRPNVKSGLGDIRQGLARSISGVLQTMATGGLDAAWIAGRLDALDILVDKAARLLTPEDASAVREMAGQVAGIVADPAVQARLKRFGDRIAAGKP